MVGKQIVAMLALAAMLAVGAGCALSHRGFPDDRAAETDQNSTDLVEADADAFTADSAVDADADDADAMASDGADLVDVVDVADIAEDTTPPDVPAEVGADVVPDVPADVSADVPADVPPDVPPPPPPVLIDFQNGSDVSTFGDYWVRSGHSDTTLGAWSNGHCVRGIASLTGSGNWYRCTLDVSLSPGDVLDFYAVYPSGTEVCGYGTSCPSPYIERYVVRQGTRDYLGAAGAISAQSETVAGRVYRFLRVYL